MDVERRDRFEIGGRSAHDDACLTSCEPGSALRFVVADSLALLREGLVRLLSSVWPSTPVVAAARMTDLIERLQDGPAGLLLIDLDLPGLGGAEGLARLRRRWPALRVAVLANEDRRETILQCLGAGVHGYILKSVSSDQLCEAIRTIGAGGVHVPATLADVLDHPRRSVTPPQDEATDTMELTARQQDVLRLLAEGRSTKDIARRLGLAVSTVKVHIAAIYRAIGARNRVEAVLRFSRLGQRPACA
jgi:DNA-binding NarL/FixJ family response regulator